MKIRKSEEMYISEVSRKDRIRNEYHKGSIGLTDIRDKIRGH